MCKGKDVAAKEYRFAHIDRITATPHSCAQSLHGDVAGKEEKSGRRFSKIKKTENK